MGLFLSAGLCACALFDSQRRTDGPPRGAAGEREMPSALEREIVDELNLARTNPAIYSSLIEEWRPYYDGTLRSLPGQHPVRTREGLQAIDDAIRFLETAQPAPPLEYSQGLSLAARDHVDDTGPVGDVGHVGNDGSRAADRVSRYGTWNKLVGENISYGGDRARDLVIRLIVDDGVPGRGHRTNLYNPAYRYVGVAFGAHKTYGTMCVMNLAAEFKE
jgi:uncharacterized protein YkwD